ncbi:MAG: hypothetical protein ACRD6W_17890, partial [Nitrososphaerales archaeon]
SLRNGIVVSTPSYPDEQAFCTRLIRAVETANPDFAWVQFLFVKSDYGSELVRLKNSMHRAKLAIEQPAIDIVSGEEHDRRELHRDFYRRSDVRMKKVDDIASKPTVTLAIQGMWVADSDSNSLGTLPFDHCSDEHDSLAVFQYRDPRMLLELVDRRMVEDISEYLRRYTGSRLEPPSFIVTPEELKSYIHLPLGEEAQSNLHSVRWGPSRKAFGKGQLGGQEPAYEGGPPSVPAQLLRIVEVPRTKDVPNDVAVLPFNHLASQTVRTFEIVYCPGRTDLLLSARTLDDMGSYADLFYQVYGELVLEKAVPRPEFLKQLASLIVMNQPKANA